MEKDHTISEDDHKRHADLGAEGDRSGDHDIDQLLAAKEKEIMTV